MQEKVREKSKSEAGKKKTQLIGDVTMKDGHVASFNRQRATTS